MRIKTFSELEAEINELLPDALFDETMDGEIIIKTGLKYSDDAIDDELESI